MNQTTQLAHRAKRLTGDFTPDGIEHQVDAFALRQFLHRFGERAVRKRQNVISSEASDF